MSKRDPNYDPELAKQIKANLKAAQARGADGPLPTGMAGVSSRMRMGFIGTEPYEARRPVLRTYASLWGALIATLLTLSGSVPAGGALLIVALVVGVPKTWTWAHDRLGSGLWSVGLALAIAGEVIWATGGAAAHGTLTRHSGSSTALTLTVIGGFISVLSGFRRWGTGARSPAGTPRARNAADAAVLAEAVARETAPPRPGAPGPASDADTARALDDAYRRDR